MYSTSSLNFDKSFLFYLVNFLSYSVFSILYPILSCSTIPHYVIFCIQFYHVFYSILSCSLFYSTLSSFLFCQYLAKLQKLSNSKLVLNIKKMFRTKILEIQVLLSSFDFIRIEYQCN